MKYKLADYDGGLDAHPVPEHAGHLWLVGSWWELHFKHAEGFVNGELADYVLEALPVDSRSCLVSIRELETDGEILCTFLLPGTSADRFVNDLNQSLGELEARDEQKSDESREWTADRDEREPTDFLTSMPLVTGSELRVEWRDSKPHIGYWVLDGENRVGWLELGGRDVLARIASSDGEWCLKKRLRVGWELIIESSAGEHVGWYSGRKWLPGGTISFTDETQADLRRSLTRRWKVEALDGQEQFLDIRTSGVPSAQTLVVTIRVPPPGPAGGHLLLLASCAVLMLDRMLVFQAAQ